jgi:hypothetical protein
MCMACCAAMWHINAEVALPRLAMWHVGGPTCQVSLVVGPTWLRWTNGVLTRGTEVAQ